MRQTDSKSWGNFEDSFSCGPAGDFLEVAGRLSRAHLPTLHPSFWT